MPDKTMRPAAEHQPPPRKRVLLVAFDPFTQESVSVVLNTMGWASAAVSDLDGVPPALQQGSFEAVLISLSHPADELERMILEIREIRPTLSERIVLVTTGAVKAEILELIERYDLSHLPQEKVLSRLWSTLEDLVAFPPWCKVAARNIGVARLLYDSLRMSSIGIRSSHKSSRHFTYEHNNTMIDVLLEVQPGSNRISLTGQVLDGTKPEATFESLGVVLSARQGTLARTTTNRMGEFSLQFEFAENVSLEIRVGERSWICVPLTQLDWAKERMQKYLTGT